MKRFFIKKTDIKNNKLFIAGREARHIHDVMRMKKNSVFRGIDGEGYVYDCVIESISKSGVNVEILNIKKSFLRTANIVVACAIPKKSKMDYIVEKLSEIGIRRLIPMITRRTEIKLDKTKTENKIKRWRNIAIAAAKQCKRTQVLLIDEPKNIRAVLKESADFKLKLIAYVDPGQTKIQQALPGAGSDCAIALIGPEGDFDKSEIQLAKQAGFLPVSLGDLVLKVDTAAIVISTLLMYNLSRSNLGKKRDTG